MIIGVSVKTTRMYANDFNAPKKQLSKQWHLNFFVLIFESLISIWKFLIFIFSEKKKDSGKLPKFSEKNAGLLYKKSEKRKVVQAYFSI